MNEETEGDAADDAVSGSVRRCLLVVNPNSRKGREQTGTLIAALHEAGVRLFGDAPIVCDALPDTLRKQAATLDPATDRILVAGGDGTINRLLPYLVEAAVPLAIIPTGTANDLARTLGIPDEPAQAVEVALDGPVRSIDLGRVNGVLFANVASLGLGPKVTEHLSAQLKARAGVLAYLRALFSAYRDIRPFRCRIAADGGPQRRLHSIHVAIGNGRYYGGGATVFEGAAIDDRRLDLYSLSPLPLWRLLLRAPWLALGRHRELSEVYTVQGATLSVRTSRRLPISADGEIIARTPAQFDVLPGVLQVIAAHRTTPGLRQDVESDYAF
ncbi:MAG: lipid kinase [Thiogranum sp.]|nr:lipid kinase [Thiogranum sp.]